MHFGSACFVPREDIIGISYLMLFIVHNFCEAFELALNNQSHANSSSFKLRVINNSFLISCQVTHKHTPEILFNNSIFF